MKKIKHRLQFDLTPEALKQLDEIKNKANLNTRAEVVRNALRLYTWCLDKKAEGFQFQIKKDSQYKDLEFLF
jgi:metal-responsive CopG/Arc/MetJ family transcriptional regulator